MAVACYAPSISFPSWPQVPRVPRNGNKRKEEIKHGISLRCHLRIWTLRFDIRSLCFWLILSSNQVEQTSSSGYDKILTMMTSSHHILKRLPTPEICEQAGRRQSNTSPFNNRAYIPTYIDLNIRRVPPVSGKINSPRMWEMEVIMQPPIRPQKNQFGNKFLAANKRKSPKEIWYQNSPFCSRVEKKGKGRKNPSCKQVW